MFPEHSAAGIERTTLDSDKPVKPLLAELQQFVAQTRSRIQTLADSIERCRVNRAVAAPESHGEGTPVGCPSLPDVAVDGDPAARLTAIKRRLATRINQTE